MLMLVKLHPELRFNSPISIPGDLTPSMERAHLSNPQTDSKYEGNSVVNIYRSLEVLFVCLFVCLVAKLCPTFL